MARGSLLIGSALVLLLPLPAGSASSSAQHHVHLAAPASPAAPPGEASLGVAPSPLDFSARPRRAEVSYSAPDGSLFFEGVFMPLAGGAGSNALLEGHEDGVGSNARFSAPQGVALLPTGVAYVSDAGNNMLRRVSPEGNVSHFAGGGATGVPGFVDATGVSARFFSPSGLAVLNGSLVFCVDTGNHAIRTVTPEGVVTTFAGGRTTAGKSMPGFVNGVGSAALFRSPVGISVFRDSSIFVADAENHAIRVLTYPLAATATYAGGGSESSGVAGFIDGSGAVARFSSPQGVAVDPEFGTLYVSDRGNNAIRAITPSGFVTTLAGGGGVLGSGVGGLSDGAGTSAAFMAPTALAFSSLFQGVIIADAGNAAVRLCSVEGVVETYAGAVPDEVTGYVASFVFPTGVDVDAKGSIFIVDSNASAVLRAPLLSYPNRTLPNVTGALPSLAVQKLVLGYAFSARSNEIESLRWTSGNLSLLGVNDRSSPPFHCNAFISPRTPLNEIEANLLVCNSFVSFLRSTASQMPRIDYENPSAFVRNSTFDPNFSSLNQYARGIVSNGGVFVGLGVIISLFFAIADVCACTRYRRISTLEDELAEYEAKSLLMRACGPRVAFCSCSCLVIAGAATALVFAIISYGNLYAVGESFDELRVALDISASAASKTAGPSFRLAAASLQLLQLATFTGSDPDAFLFLPNVTEFARAMTLAAAAVNVSSSAVGNPSTLSSGVSALLSGAISFGISWTQITAIVTSLATAAPAFVASSLILLQFTLMPTSRCAKFRRRCSCVELIACISIWATTGVFFALTLVLADVCVDQNTSVRTLFAYLRGSTLNDASWATLEYVLSKCYIGELPSAALDLLNPSSIPQTRGGDNVLLSLSLSSALAQGRNPLYGIGPYNASLLNASGPIPWGARLPQSSLLHAIHSDYSRLSTATTKLVASTSCSALSPPFELALHTLCNDGFFNIAMIGIMSLFSALALVFVLASAVPLCRFHPGDVRAIVRPEELADGTRPKHGGLRYTAEGGRFQVAQALGQFFGARGTSVAIEVLGAIDPKNGVLEPSWVPPRPPAEVKKMIPSSKKKLQNVETQK